MSWIPQRHSSLGPLYYSLFEHPLEAHTGIASVLGEPLAHMILRPGLPVPATLAIHAPGPVEIYLPAQLLKRVFTSLRGWSVPKVRLNKASSSS